MISKRELYRLFFKRSTKYNSWNIKYPRLTTVNFDIKDEYQILTSNPNIFKITLCYNANMFTAPPDYDIYGYITNLHKQQLTGEYTYYACTIQYYFKMFAEYHQNIIEFSDDYLNLYKSDNVTPNYNRIVCDHKLNFVNWENITNSEFDLGSLVAFYFNNETDKNIGCKIDDFFRTGAVTTSRIRNLFCMIYESCLASEINYPSPIPILDMCDDIERGNFWRKQISKNATGKVKGILTSKQADSEYSISLFRPPRYNVNDLNEIYSDSTCILNTIAMIHGHKASKDRRKNYLWDIRYENKNMKRRNVRDIIYEQYNEYLLSLDD